MFYKTEKEKMFAYSVITYVMTVTSYLDSQ